MTEPFFTVGHSNRSLQEFVDMIAWAVLFLIAYFRYIVLLLV